MKLQHSHLVSVISTHCNICKLNLYYYFYKQFVDLRNNVLNEFPADLKYLKSLEYLNIDGLNTEVFPSDISNFTHLKRLFCIK